jgi:ketosteroid isomerase-like protein
MTSCFRHAAALIICAAMALTAANARADQQGISLSPAAQAAEQGTPEVRAAVERFYAALNAMFTGELKPMTELWSRGADVTYMGPGGGFRHGWIEVLADWQAQAAMKLGGSVEPKDISITVGRDLAIVSDIEVGHNVVDGKRQDLALRATNLFRKEGGKWKMIGHHTDLLPYLQK